MPRPVTKVLDNERGDPICGMVHLSIDMTNDHRNGWPKKVPNVAKQSMDWALLRPVLNSTNNNRGVILDDDPIGMQLLYSLSDTHLNCSELNF